MTGVGVIEIDVRPNDQARLVHHGVIAAGSTVIFPERLGHHIQRRACNNWCSEYAAGPGPRWRRSLSAHNAVQRRSSSARHAAALRCCGLDPVMAAWKWRNTAPRSIKQAIVGRGAADKQQVQHMVRISCFRCRKQPIPNDAADALAVAIMSLPYAGTRNAWRPCRREAGGMTRQSEFGEERGFPQQNNRMISRLSGTLLEVHPPQSGG